MSPELGRAQLPHFYGSQLPDVCVLRLKRDVGAGAHGSWRPCSSTEAVLGGGGRSQGALGGLTGVGSRGGRGLPPAPPESQPSQALPTGRGPGSESDAQREKDLRSLSCFPLFPATILFFNSGCKNEARASSFRVSWRTAVVSFLAAAERKAKDSSPGRPWLRRIKPSELHLSRAYLGLSKF